MLQNYWKFPNRNVQTIVFVYHDTNGQNHGPVRKTQSFLLSEICTVILWQDCYGKGNLRKSYWSTVGRRFPIVNAYSYTVKRVTIICVCEWHRIGWKEKNINPMWQVQNKEVDLGEPTSFLDHVYLACTQRQCEISKDIVDKCRTMFESRISEGAIEKLQCSENLHISSWSYDMEERAKKWVERYCELVNKTTQQLYKVSTPCIDDSHFKEEELKSVGELSKVCSRVVLRCLCLPRIWKTWYSMVGEQTCLFDHKMDQSLWQRIILLDILHPSHMWLQTICHVETQHNKCILGLFQDSDFAGDLEDSKSTWGGTLCIFGSHTLVPISWMCKKQTTGSRSSTESEIIPWTQDWRWTAYPHLIYGIWSSQFFTETRIRVRKHGETCARTFVQYLTNFKNERNLMEWLMIWTMLILFPQTSILLVRKLCCMCLKAKQWSRWS